VDATIYAQRMPIDLTPSTHGAACLDFPKQQGSSRVGKRIQVPDAEANSGFGERLTALRKAAGFTQMELAAKLGISQRMVAYYEHPEATPPARLLPLIAKALGVSIDDLYGRSPARKRLATQEGDSRLRRRLLAIEKLDAAEKRLVLQLLDAFIERGQLKRKVESRA
jgi:transcriptional regulator with XRE-family HTH domain